jgi:hypothetical protein
MVAATDLNVQNNSNGNSDSSGEKTVLVPHMNFIFSVAIGDKASFQKLIDAAKKITQDMGAVNDTSIAFGQNDKLFAVSNHQHFLNDYLAGNTNNNYDFLNKLSGHPVGLFIDVHKILSTVAARDINNPDDKVIMDASLNMWNTVYITGGNFKDGGITGNTEIDLTDQTTNSLKQLNHYFDIIAKSEMDKKEKERSATNNIDSLITPPPIDSVGHK